MDFYFKRAIGEEYAIIMTESNLAVCSVEDKSLGGSFRGNEKRRVLYEIAEKTGFEYNPRWNTHYFASKLVDFLLANELWKPNF